MLENRKQIYEFAKIANVPSCYSQKKLAKYVFYEENSASMLKKLIYVGAILLSAVCMMQTLEAKHRKVAVQTYSLNRFTLEEAINKLKDMGLDGIECYPGQKISNSMPDQKMGPDMSPEAKAFVKKMLKDANLKIVSFGVTGADNEAQIRKLCEFAKENNMPAVAITDHGVMYSAIEFYRTAKEMGVKSFHFYIGEAISKIDDDSIDKELAIKVFGSNPEDLNYGLQAFQLACYASDRYSMEPDFKKSKVMGLSNSPKSIR